MLHLVNAAHSFPGGEQPSDPRGRPVKAWDLFLTCSPIPRPLHGPTEPGPQGIAPNLVSLDLSFNNLTELLELVSQLSSLQKLRVLVLQGNPLALIPAYRGFVVDGLPQLSVLDDIHIEPDERHQFRGLARQPGELIRSEAQVVVSIGKIKGVPDPSTLQELEVDTKAAAITYSYCVTYEFAEGEEMEDGGSAESPAVATLGADSSARDMGETKGQQESAAMEEPMAHGRLMMGNKLAPVLSSPQKEKVTSIFLIFFSCAAHLFVTPGKPWADTIDCSYRKEHTAKDLVGLKGYLAAGTIVSVVEEKVSVWQVFLHPRPLDKFLPAGPVPKDKQKQKQQEKKKKKQPCELRSDPPIRRTLGSRRVSLEALLATEDLVATVCDFGILITEQPLQPPSLEEKVVRSIKNKDPTEPEEGRGLEAVPLTVEFQVQLLRWPSAAAQSPWSTVAVDKAP
uniref:Leucine rich repeat containing 43 n=1 Tax=Anas platyrhynchos platyrhynchos TaxID=8840 RepID=A0A493SSM6_ANAPP